MKNLSVSAYGTEISLIGDNLIYKIKNNNFTWISEGRQPHLVFQRKIAGKYRWFFIPFSCARVKEHKAENNSLISIFSGFNVYGKNIPAVFTAKAEIKEDGKIDFSLSAENEGDYDLKAAFYPSGFNAVTYEKKDAYTIDPMRQGFILPDGYKKNRKAIEFITKYWRKISTGDAYLPLWGRVCGRYGYSAFLDESYDATLFSSYGKNRSLITSVNWMGSLGRLSYKRTVHMKFYKDCTYVTAAKDFRQHEKNKGNLISIDDKIKMNPDVKKLIGTPVIHWSLYEHNCPGTKIYKQTGVEDKVHNTFDETCEKFRKFSQAGLKKAYVHTDGWGNRGYDNLHPYILPPAEKTGGWEGMKRLSDTCEELGYYFGLHDQYRDYYHDSPVYDKEKCVHDVNMHRPFCKIWAGGPHNWLCSEYALTYVEKTYNELWQHGIKLSGTYLDVFGIMWGDECYHPMHRITRKESIEKRGACFDWLRSKGMIVSSEETGCQMVKYLDLVHHAPYAVTPQGGGPAVGIPVPLTNLVYHDCVFVPWCVEGKGGWGIPDNDSGKLHCILNAQTPYFNNSMKPGACAENDDELKFNIKNVQEIASVNEKLYNKELIKHEFVNGNLRIQRNTFSDGTKITVDFDRDTYKIDWA